MNLSDLGGITKKQNPGEYDHLPDREVGLRMRDKYPEYSHIQDDPIRTYQNPVESSQNLHYIGSIVLWIISIGLLVTGCAASKTDPPALVWHTVLSIVFGVFAAKLWWSGRSAYETVESNTRSEVEIQQNRNALRREIIRGKHVARETEEEAVLGTLRRETEAKAEVTRQRALDTAHKEFELRDQLLDVGMQKGLTPDAVVEVNKHEYLNQSDIEKDHQMRMNELKGILAVKLFAHTKQKELRLMIKELLVERHKIQTSKLPKSVKTEYLAILDDTITAHKGAYNVGQNRLLEAVTGETVEGSDEDADLSGGVGHGGTEIEDEI